MPLLPIQFCVCVRLCKFDGVVVWSLLRLLMYAQVCVVARLTDEFDVVRYSDWTSAIGAHVLAVWME